ncbi:MAG: hypothetical protein IPJ41_01790 [Phycisphaerales bacterium]|nr:hypothetical protein [Phycisphaerales bacterium]
MGLGTSYIVRERVRAAWRLLEEHRTLVALSALAGVMTLAYAVFFMGPFGARQMVILYRPSPDLGTVVFNLDDEYRLRNIRVVSLDESGREGETVWKFRPPGDAPKASTFVYGVGMRGAKPDDAAPALAPGKTYRLFVGASGAKGSIDFRIDPKPRRARG